MPRSIHVPRRDGRCSVAAARGAWHARADQEHHVTRTRQRSRSEIDSQRRKSGQLLQPTLHLVHGLMSVLLVAALSFIAHFAEKWQSVGKREDCVIGDENSEEDNMPSPTRQNGRSRSSSAVTRKPVARQRHYLRRIQQRRTPSSHIICCPTEEEEGARERYCHVTFPPTLDKNGAVITDCDPKESSQENLSASDIQTSSRHRRHIPAGFTKTPSQAEEQIEDTEPDGTSHLEGLKSDATSKEACRLPPKNSEEMKAVHKYTHGSDEEAALYRKMSDISLHHSKPDVYQDEIDHSLWKVRLGISVCQSDPASEAPSCQNSIRDRARVYSTDLENGAVSQSHECGEGQSSKDGGQQQTQRGNFKGRSQDKGQGSQCRTEAAGGLRGSASGGGGGSGGDDDDDRERKDEKRKMDEYLHLKNQRKKKKKKKKKKMKKAARAVKEGITEMTSDDARTWHVLSGPVSNTAARSTTKGHGWMVNQVNEGDDAVHHSNVLSPLPSPPPPSACGNDHKPLLPQSEAIPPETTKASSSSFSAGDKSSSQQVNDFETQPFGHGQFQPIAAEDIVTQPFNSDQWQNTVFCSKPSHGSSLVKHPQQCEEDLQRERDLLSTQGELEQISLLEDAPATQASSGQPAELKEVSGLRDICPVEVQFKRPQQCQEDLTLNAAAISSPGHHGDGQIVHHDTGPQQAHSPRAVRSQVTIRPNVVLVEKCSHDMLREILRDKLLENWYLRSRFRCQKCRTNNFTLVLCPCGHLLCRACGHTQTRCPVCNSVVESENFASFF